MPEKLQFVRPKRQGLLDQVFGIQPRRSRRHPNFRDNEAELPRLNAENPRYTRARRYSLEAERQESPRYDPPRRRAARDAVRFRHIPAGNHSLESTSSESASNNSPRRGHPRRAAWHADETMFQGLGRREPEHRAPAPPRETAFDGGGSSGKQEFKFVKGIGEGGQGRCDLFKRKGDGKLFVYKVMKCEVRLEDGKPREVKILKDILGNHPRLCKLYFHTWTPSRTAFFFEYCSAGDLSDLIRVYHKRHSLEIPESFIWHVYLQLAEALAFIHTNYDRTGSKRPKFQPIIHRDIKPQNIFIRKPASSHEYPQMVLADFGLATTDKETDSLCGSFLWQGPEIPIHSREGDCWAVGACIHAMATGGPPISATPPGRSEERWASKPQARKVSNIRTRGYSKHLDDALYKVLRTQRSDRLIGRDLVKSIERAREDWGGHTEPLESWALKN